MSPSRNSCIRITCTSRKNVSVNRCGSVHVFTILWEHVKLIIFIIDSKTLGATLFTWFLMNVGFSIHFSQTIIMSKCVIDIRVRCANDFFFAVKNHYSQTPRGMPHTRNSNTKPLFHLLHSEYNCIHI